LGGVIRYIGLDIDAEYAYLEYPWHAGGSAAQRWLGSSAAAQRRLGGAATACER
jgi:hypothetical protein